MMAGWDMSPAGWIWMLVWVAALLLMVWLVVRPSGGRRASEDPQAVLRARFATGEIDKAAFERARDTLRDDPDERIR